MATRSTIAVVTPDQTVQQVYCHWDGYVSNNGKTLVDYYNELSKVLELVSHGDMSYLEKQINPTGNHSFDKPENGVTVYYGRDRGESDVGYRTYANFDDYVANGQREEYNYIFKDGEWYVDTTADQWTKVADLLVND